MFGVFIDKINNFIGRFFGFLVYILNIMIKENGFFCFKDMSFIRDMILNYVNIICIMYGRYVIYYNNRIILLYFVGYLIDGVYNEFCEVEVWGI